MSYNMRAYGLAKGSNYLYPKQMNIDEGDVYSDADTIDKLGTIGGIPSTGSVSGGMQRLLDTWATMNMYSTLAHLLFVYTKDSKNGEIWLSRLTPGGMMEGPSYGTRRMQLYRDYRTNLRFFYLSAKNLGINRWGILRGICLVMTNYIAHCEKHGYFDPSVLRIELEF
jgi:hypothetical protein